MAAPAIGAGLSVGGNLISGLDKASALRKQNRILTQGSRTQSRYGQEASNTTADFLNQLRGSAPNPAAERGAFTGALTGSPGVSGPVTAGSRFAGDAAGATAGARGYGTNLADLFARIRAPQLQRRSEDQLMTRMGEALRPISMRSQDDDFLTQLRASQAQANPWLQLGSNLLSNAGNYMVSNGY